MKSTEFHKLVRQYGWIPTRQSGSHVIYEKDGVMVIIPYHGSKEMKKGLVMKLMKQMGSNDYGESSGNCPKG